MSDIKKKRAPSVSANQRAWTTVYDDLNDVINSVNQKSAVESRDGTSGLDGDIRLFKDIDKSKYFIEGKFKDGWAKRELLFSDSNNETQDESINFSATESYIKPDGTVPFTDKVSGITPTNTAHLATKGYADTGRLTSITKSGNNLVFGMTDTASNITFSQFGSNAFNSTSIPTTFVASLTNADASGQTLIEASTGSLYRLGGGDNITITTDDPGGGQTWVQIDCDINTNNFLASSVNRLAGVRSFEGDSIDWTQNAGAGGYITFDDEGSNVTFENVTVDSDNKPAVRITAPTTTNTNYYLTGVTKSGNTLTFAVSGASDPTYTFGSNAFNSTSYLTGITSTLATNESASPPRVSLLDNSSTICALEEGSGISIEESSTGGGNTVKISSTVNTSGLLTNGIVIIEDWNGSEVEETASASGADKLRFVENDGIEWSISGPTNDVISVTPSLSANFDNYSSWTIKDHDGTTYAITSGDILWIKEGTGNDVNFTADDELTITSTVTNTDTKWDGSSGAPFDADTAKTSLGLNTGNDVRFDSFGVGTNASGTTG